MAKNKVKNIDEAIKDVEKRQQEAQNTKKDAEKIIEEANVQIEDADKEIAQTEETKEKLNAAKEKQKEADEAREEALAAGGYKTTSNNNNNGKKKGKGLVKGIIIGATAVSLIVGGYHIVKHSKTGKLKWFNKNSKNPSSNVEITNPTDNNEIIYDSENNKVTISTDAVNNETINQEKLEIMVTKFTKYLSDKQINVDTEDVLKFVVITNLDNLKEDCPELVKEIMGTQSQEEFLGDAFNVIGAAMNYNFKTYETEGKTDNFIRFSEVVHDEAGKQHLLIIEKYMDEIAKAKDNSEEQDRLVSELIDTIYNPSKELENIEEGIGLASMLAINDIANHVTFVDGVCQISEKNRGILINHTSAELYIPGIFANLEECQQEELTMSYYDNNSYSSYTRKYTI